MRILLVLASADMSIADVSRGYCNALIRAGHDVRTMPLNKWIRYHTGRMDDHETATDAANDLRRHTAVLQLASEKALIDAMRHQAELVIVVSGMAFHPDALALMRRAGFKTALVCTESPYDDEEQQYLASLCDVVTVNDRASLAVLQHPNLHYLAAAYDPAVHIPQCVGPEYASDVFFVGTGFTERKELLEAVDWTGIDLRLYGYWATVNAYSPINRYITQVALHNSESVRWYAGTKVGVNLHRDGAGWSANPRVYELAAVGTHQVVDSRRPEVRELLGDSACYFDGPYDFEDRVRACLADPEHRQKSAAVAQERIQGQTFDARVADLLSWL